MESRSRKHRRKKKQKMSVVVFLTLLLLLCLSIFVALASNVAGEKEETEKKAEKVTHKPIKQPVVAENEGKKDNEPMGAGIETEKEEPIELLFVGDLLMDWSTKLTMDEKGVDYPFVHVKEEVAKADIAIANLEQPLTTRDASYKDLNQMFNFQGKPEHIQGPINAGFDLVSLGNNHALDYGEEGLLDTFQALNQYKLDYIGAGKSKEEAFQAKTYEIKGKRIKIMASSRFVPSVSWYTFHEGTKAGLASAYDLDYLVQKVKEEKADADYLFMFIHWGVEKTFTPADYQKQYVQQLVLAGIDGIIGSHPHVLQGFEYYEDVPVAYSLGNFLFPSYVKEDTAETGLLKLTIDQGQVSMAFKPYFIKNDQITPLSQLEEQVILEKLEARSYGVKIEGYEIKKANK
jgi:poly-gamma-glutamate synthesis protein (capsule biosynthesis protein)